MRRFIPALFALPLLALALMGQEGRRVIISSDPALAAAVAANADPGTIARVDLVLPQFVQKKDAPAGKRGARRTPLDKIVEALRTRRAIVHRVSAPTPAQVAMIPGKLDMWGNDVHGDCVSAESAFSMAAYSVYLGLPEIFIPPDTLVKWADAHGFLEGANLLDVIQAMAQDGIKDDQGVLRKAGTPSVVDYTNEGVLQNAIATGPVSFAMDANDLPSGAGTASGWSVWNGPRFDNTDHCMSFCGYGPAKYLFDKLGAPVPAGAPAGTLYLAYTWKTIGVVDAAWIKATVREAWVRTPTVTGLTPPAPTPTPTPTPTPAAVTLTLTPAQVQSVLQQAGTTQPVRSFTLTVNPDGSATLTPNAAKK